MLSVIVPTFNEASNIRTLVGRIFAAAKGAGIDCEVVVVDDGSPDGTGEIAESLKSRFKVKVLERGGKKGLASAVIDGFGIASGDVLCVMDADLSHPPEAIPDMYRIIDRREADFVIGSRLVEGGGSSDWSAWRKFVSFVARAIARPITSVRDLTAGYFMLRKNVIDGVKLNPIGFKICLEIIVRGRYNKIKEVPIMFAGRVTQKSKLGARQVFEYLYQLLTLYPAAIAKKLKGGR
jgi:dolichol-phosphate mannosyltransferase